MLLPQLNASRTWTDLDGMWHFQADEPAIDVNQPLPHPEWVAVPGSFNAQLMGPQYTDRVGYFWYETHFQLPSSQLKQRNVLRFGAVTHAAEVYLNGHLIMKHKGGFTPFEGEINQFLQAGDNDLKVKVSNILDNTTLPSADYKGDGQETYRFDFYNYSGIQRQVIIYSTNPSYIDQITIPYETDLTHTTVKPEIKVQGDFDHAQVTILDQTKQVVAQNNDLTSPLKIDQTHLWEPGNGYLYQLQVKIFAADGQLLDTYTKSFGIRTIEIKNNQFLINQKPFYFKGFGKHMDFFASGRGMNLPLMNWDNQILNSIGANSFRTSHYPNDEITMQQADRLGQVVIDETSAVGLFIGFNANVEVLKNNQTTWNTLDTTAAHQLAIKELVERDADHPSVVMWSIANEPAGGQPGAREYFAPLVKLTKELDWQKRPVTFTDIMRDDYQDDQIADLFDVICLNRYYGWYSNHGNLKAAEDELRDNIIHWHEKHPDKPFIFTEFGADTVPGLHSLEHSPYSEEYQVDLYKTYFKVFDEFSYVIGEQLWAYADFHTQDNMIRIDGNLKGVFTRDRRPKAIVSLLKQRWLNK
ncbi:beta-glucuronidase [Limosilactobacillus secaliphilus]|nr:beta-glucuronidase [Limosilactobacillus secaliphilus]